MPRLIWLVRHGQSVANAGLPTTGHAEVPLTDKGHEQALEVAQAMSTAPDLIVTSRFTRARQTADAIVGRWPAAPLAVWPIHEVTYLDPQACAGMTGEGRKPLIDDYWRRADPDYRHGAGAETFAEFVARVEAFAEDVAGLPDDFVVVVGHGQFLRAYLLALEEKLAATPGGMAIYRAEETAAPLANGQIVVLGPPL